MLKRAVKQSGKNSRAGTAARLIRTVLILPLLFAGCASTGREAPDSPGTRSSSSSESELSRTEAPTPADQAAPVSRSGRVTRRVEARGTLSEYDLFLLETGAGTPLILFNAKGYSTGLDEWEGVWVTVSGELFEGRIGSTHKRAEGVRVSSIQKADQ